MLGFDFLDEFQMYFPGNLLECKSVADPNSGVVGTSDLNRLICAFY